MMKINVDTGALETQGITINELLTLVTLKYPHTKFVFTPIIFRSLVNKGLARTTGSTLLTEQGEEVVNTYIISAENNISELAQNLRDLYPSGKKGGTYYWRGNLTEIETKLKVFFKKYGTFYTQEQIEAATSKYINSFDDTNRDRAMMLLKYFIEKQGTSTLLSYLDNIEEATQLEIDYGKSRSL